MSRSKLLWVVYNGWGGILLARDDVSIFVKHKTGIRWKTSRMRTAMTIPAKEFQVAFAKCNLQVAYVFWRQVSLVMHNLARATASHT